MRTKITTFLIACGFIAHAQTNLLPSAGNYGFENGTSSNAYWWYLNGSPTYANFLWQTTEVHSGSAAYQLNITTAGTEKWHIQVASSNNTAATYPTIATGLSYTVQFWMKTSNGTGTVRVSNSGSAPYTGDLTITQGAWALYSFPFTGNGTTFRPSIDIGTAGVGTYYIDDVVLYQTTSLSVNDAVKLKSDIYPNPANDVIHLDPAIYADSKTIIVYDINGNKVINKPAEKMINISKLPKGMYLLTTEKGKPYKFIKK